MLLKMVIIVMLVTLARPSLFKDNHIDEGHVAEPRNLDVMMMNLNTPYIEQDTAVKMDQINSFFPTQADNNVQFGEWHLTRTPIEGEEQLFKKRIELMKKENPVLAEMYIELYEKSRDFDSTAEKIVKYIMNVDGMNKDFSTTKNLLHPLESQMIESVKNFRTIFK